MESESSSPADPAGDLVVCTRHRPAEVRACLETVALQTRVPTCTVVVDSSDDDATLEVVEELVRAWPGSSSLIHLWSAPATTRQRNVGIDATTSRVVHFVDDDTLLEPGYMEAILQVFSGDDEHEIGGVGGFITNQPPHRFGAVDRWLGLDSCREGVVLPSGRNTRLYSEPAKPVDVDWLPGCAMSFRREVFAHARPNSRRGADRNGEDVDLSYRVRQHSRLVITPGARMRHLEAAEGRRSVEQLTVVELLSRYERVAAGTGVLSRRAFWVSAWGQLGWYFVKACLSISRSRFAIARATARGIRIIRAARRSGALIVDSAG